MDSGGSEKWGNLPEAMELMMLASVPSLSNLEADNLAHPWEIPTKTSLILLSLTLDKFSQSQYEELICITNK